MKFRIKRLNWKRIVIISSIVVVTAALVVYVLASVQAWNTTNATTTQASSNLKKSVDTKLATETAPASTQAALDSILKSYTDTLKKGPCELPSLYEWQSNLPWLKDGRQKCLVTSHSSEQLAVALGNMQTFLKNEAAAAVLIKQATESTASTTDYTAAAATWQKVADDKSLVTQDAFKPVGANITEVSTAVAQAYTALAAANTKQDKTAFNDGEKALTSAYARFTEVKTASNTARTGLVDAIVKAYSTI
jgi:hypothetical protein